MTENSQFNGKYLGRFLVLIGITMLCAMVFSIVILFITSKIYNIPLNELNGDYITKSTTHLQATKMVQMFSTISIFFLSAFIFIKSYRGKPNEVWQLKSFNGLGIFLRIIVLALCFMVIGSIFSSINQSIDLGNGDFGKTVRATELKYKALTEAFLDMKNTGDFLLNMLMVAIIPGICEEIFFRGTLQKLFKSWTKNIHISIVLTSLIFALIHFKFTQILPIFMISIFLGYIYYLTGNLWYSITAHILNNGLVVALAYFGKGNKAIEKLMDDSYSPNFIIVSIALIIASFIFYDLYKKKVNNISPIVTTEEINIQDNE